jgi:hypothetical protein
MFTRMRLRRVRGLRIPVRGWNGMNCGNTGPRRAAGSGGRVTSPNADDKIVGATG